MADQRGHERPRPLRNHGRGPDNCTATTIEQTRAAKAAGADAALIVTPYYNRPSQEGLYRHFAAVASAVDLPIILYNVPKRTGVDLQVGTVEQLAKIPTSGSRTRAATSTAPA